MLTKLRAAWVDGGNGSPNEADKLFRINRCASWVPIADLLSQVYPRHEVRVCGSARLRISGRRCQGQGLYLGVIDAPQTGRGHCRSNLMSRAPFQLYSWGRCISLSSTQ